MTEETNAQLDSMVATAQRVAVLEYREQIQSVLYEINNTCARAALDLIDARLSEKHYESFTASWDKLKKLIWEIENGKEPTQ